jgi:hypothetical protein
VGAVVVGAEAAGQQPAAEAPVEQQQSLAADDLAGQRVAEGRGLDTS